MTQNQDTTENRLREIRKAMVEYTSKQTIKKFGWYFTERKWDLGIFTGDFSQYEKRKSWQTL